MVFVTATPSLSQKAILLNHQSITLVQPSNQCLEEHLTGLGNQNYKGIYTKYIWKIKPIRITVVNIYWKIKCISDFKYKHPNHHLTRATAQKCKTFKIDTKHYWQGTLICKSENHQTFQVAKQAIAVLMFWRTELNFQNSFLTILSVTG